MRQLTRGVRSRYLMWFTGSIGIAIVVLGGWAVAGVSLPMPELVRPVGRQNIVLIDSSRTDPWISERREPRIVIIKAWFPASPRGDESRARYVANLDALPGKFAFGERYIAGRVRSRVLHEPPVARAPGGLPVVLFSPGADMPPDYYAGLLEDLAGRGYVVLAMDHAHEGRGQVLPDGRTLAVESERFRPPMMDRQRYRSFYRQRVEVRAADAAFVLTRLHAGAESLLMLAPHLDLTRVGALGHSLGGVAAFEMCRRDARITACANLDGMLFGMPMLDDAVHAHASDLLFIGKPLVSGTPDVETDARVRRRAEDALGSAGSGYLVVLDDAEHETFSDAPFLTPRLRSSAPRRRLAIVRDYVGRFFDATLKGDSTRSIKRMRDTYPGVRVSRIERRGKPLR